MDVLVTGAAGFLGGECLVQLEGAGHTVRTTDRRGPVEFLGDLSVPEFCRGLPGVDAVVHCAGVQYFSPDLPWRARAAYFRRNNVFATRNLVDRYRGSGTHVVFVGSSMMYEQNGTGIYGPESRFSAQGVYSASKLAAWDIVCRMPEPTAAVVPCIIAGPGRGGLFTLFARSILRFGTVIVPGRGGHPIHVVHVEDVAGLICTVVAARATGVWNAASPRPLSIREWIGEIAAEFRVHRVRRVSLPLLTIALPSRLLGYRLLAREQLLMLRHPHVLEIEASRALGWEPRWDNARTLRATIRALHAGAPTPSRPHAAKAARAADELHG